ncbi:hypothetical protein EDD32_1746 [Georgenia muralis]|uniref:Uncharacterized protein n=1 Tax=Georgenia muralis TaxID=154117 RepID=A0A3N5A1P6_9MICO|nr:hypothetical protein EDD32_1746 [Georgenia muralis]
MGTGNDDGLPFGMRSGINQNVMQPSFRDGPQRKPRRLWPIAVSILIALATIAALITWNVLR